MEVTVSGISNSTDVLPSLLLLNAAYPIVCNPLFNSILSNALPAKASDLIVLTVSGMEMKVNFSNS